MLHGSKKSLLLSVHKLLKIGVLIVFLFEGCGIQTAPQEYLASIEDMQGELAESIHEIIRYSEDLDSNMLGQAYRHTCDFAEKSMYKIQEIGPYRGDSIFYKATLNLVEAYQGVLHNEVVAMTNLVSKPGELSESDEARLLRYRRTVFVKLAEAERDFLKAANDFRRKYIGFADIEEEPETWFEEEADTTGM